MTDDKYETVLDQFGLHRLYPKNRLFFRAEQHAACAIQPGASRPAPVVEDRASPAGCCELVGASVGLGGDGRFCSDGTFCPKRLYSDAQVFVSCPTRIEKLKAKEHV
jgi:hypothetical protein